MGGVVGWGGGGGGAVFFETAMRWGKGNLICFALLRLPGFNWKPKQELFHASACSFRSIIWCCHY